MQKIIWNNLGGLKFTQNRLGYMQDGIHAALAAFAKLCGEKTIITGVQVLGGNVSAGWIVLDGEPVEFLGGPVGAKVVVIYGSTNYTYANNTLQPVEVKKTAQCGIVGDFDFSELKPLQQLQHIWQPGDLKQKHVDNAYIALNFDVAGFGLNAEIGWRRLDKMLPAAAGKVLVNLDETDPDFDEAGKTKGDKTHTLTRPEMPVHYHETGTETDSTTGVFRRGGNHAVRAWGGGPVSVSGFAACSADDGGDTPHNNLQPSFVVLTLIKL